VVPANERSRAVAFVFAGLHVGSVLGLLAAPPLIASLGWEAVFVSFGALGLVWTLWFEGLMAEIEKTDPEVAALLIGRSAASKGTDLAVAGVDDQEGEGGHTAGGDHHGAVIDAEMPIPWRAFLRNTSVQVKGHFSACVKE
jgi:ACS family sodium-dependent inorganic phosphate cotransporter